MHRTDIRIERDEIVRWLLEDTWNERFIDNILVGLCERLALAGLPVHRSTMHFAYSIHSGSARGSSGSRERPKR